MGVDSKRKIRPLYEIGEVKNGCCEGLVKEFLGNVAGGPLSAS